MLLLNVGSIERLGNCVIILALLDKQFALCFYGFICSDV